jgi:ATP-dependent DNA helicase RecG
MLHCRFFHGGFLEGKLKPGQRIVLHGKVERDELRPVRIEMVNPQFEILSGETDAGELDSTEVGRIVPIYESVAGISSRMLRRIIYAALQNLNAPLTDLLPAALLARLAYPARQEALAVAHFPAADISLEALNSFRTPAHQRLIFEEFFFYQLGLAVRQAHAARQPGIAFRIREDRVREALKRILPFKPTGAQKRVLAEIAADMEKPVPMSRLLQGDVGCGKTIVALEAATIAIENGCQVALMAPTEILATQHYLSARRIFARAGYRVDLLISGLKAAEKRAVRQRIANGEAQCVVGTHALIEEDVVFHRLGLVVVDEQHRFGVLHRKHLIEKGHGANGIRPDVLVMTATPIPRTLAMTLFGDLQTSVIDELPPGRTPVVTRAATPAQLPGVWGFVRSQLAEGRQAFVVYPVIEESKLELKAAIAEYERLSKSVFPNARLGLLHGRLSSDEKDQVMERFRSGQLQILVATTVIEVGVDVPNATVMVVEHADRFGLAQLHQLRGRIGRGAHASHCLLIAPAQPGEEAKERLDTMVRTSDGFAIAETDLRLRGPGEFFGTRQHGEMAFQLAHPLRDSALLELARREAFAMVADPAERASVARLLEQLGAHWQRRFALAAVG